MFWYLLKFFQKAGSHQFTSHIFLEMFLHSYFRALLPSSLFILGQYILQWFQKLEEKNAMANDEVVILNSFSKLPQFDEAKAEKRVYCLGEEHRTSASLLGSFSLAERIATMSPVSTVAQLQLMMDWGKTVSW